MTPKLTSRLVTLGCGIGLVIPALIGLGWLGSGSPTLISPLPVLTIVPAFLLAGLFRDAAFFKIVSVLPTLLFLAWNPSLLRGEAKIPKRSYVLLSTAIVLSVAYFIASWKWGIQYQGIRYVHTICAINLVWIAFVGGVFALSLKRSSSFGLNLFLHWIFFAWLAWYAFPYLGELP
jgi:hypothetical protein